MINQKHGQSIFLLLLIFSISFGYSIDTVNGQNLFQNNLNDNLILYLPMDHGEGNIAYDLVGSADADILGAGWFEDDTYTALEFDGESSYVTISSPPQINVNEFTISVFSNYYDIGEGEFWSSCIITQDDDSHNGGQMGFQLSRYDGHVWWWSGGREIRSLNKMELYQWYHIVITFDGEYVRMWINGNLQEEAIGGPLDYLEVAIDIGRKNPEESDFYFNGLIDDVKIFNRALDQDEIGQLYLADRVEPIENGNSNPTTFRPEKTQYQANEIPDWVMYMIMGVSVVALILICVNTVIYFRKNLFD